MPKKILIVDDDTLLTGNLKSTFEKGGFEVQTALDGSLALPILKDWKPDFILLDLLMPVMGGVELIKNIGANYPDLLSKIIVMTNSEDMEHMADVMANGVKVYVNKSNTDLDKILEMVEERMGK